MNKVTHRLYVTILFWEHMQYYTGINIITKTGYGIFKPYINMSIQIKMQASIYATQFKNIKKDIKET